MNYLLKLLVFVLHKYDYIFSDGLYSFRTSLSAKDFLLKLRQHKDFGAYYILKTDISNYVSSIVPELIIPQLSEIFGDDPALFDFLKYILLRKECIEPDGQIVSCEPGCLGGIPIANMFMNIYLMEVDSYFYPNAPLYARYSDDIIIFAESLDKAEEYRNHLLGILMKKRLHINESKTYLIAPGEEVDILGCRVKGGMLDISNLSKNKIKRRIRIHANYLLKLKKEGGLTAEEAGKRMTAYCNGIFFGHAGTNELTWSRWLFPVITETSSLKELDHYIQEAVRYVMYGSFTSKKYSITYRQLQDLGYKNLLHSYYHFKYRLK